MPTPTRPAGPEHDVTVQLLGHNANAFSLMGRVSAALRAEVGPDAADAFWTAANNCSSYEELLSLIQRTVHVR